MTDRSCAEIRTIPDGVSGTDIIPGRVVDYGRLEFIDREPPVLRCRCGYDGRHRRRRPDRVSGPIRSRALTGAAR